MAEVDGDIGIFLAQRILREADILRDIAIQTILIVRDHLHALRIKDLACAIEALGGQFGDFDAANRAAQRHHIARIILEIDGAIFIHDGAAQRELALRAAGREQILRLGNGRAILDGQKLGLAGTIADDAQGSRRIVFEEVDIDLARLFIGVGEQAAGLRIALGGAGVGDGPGGEIDDRDAVPFIRFELTDARNADIGAAVVDHRRRGTHALDALIIAAGAPAAQIQLLERIMIDIAIRIDGDGIEVAALGGEIVAVCLLIIADGAADIRADAGKIIDHAAGFRIQGEQPCRRTGIAHFAVVGADQQELIAGIRARPIEAAALGIRPHGLLGLGGLRGVFIRDGQADPVGIGGFAIPEAGIDIAVAIGDRRIRLAADGIGIDPQRFQRIGVERLYHTGQRDEDHALGIGRRRNIEGGRGDHIAGLNDLSRHRIDLQNAGIHRADQIAVHQNRRADYGGVERLARLIRPVEQGVLRGDGRGRIGDGVVIIVSAEIVPVGRNIFADGFVLLRLLKRYGQLQLILIGRNRALLHDIAIGGGDIGVIIALNQIIGAVRIGGDRADERILEHKGGVLRREAKRQLADLRARQTHRIAARHRSAIVQRGFQRNGDRLFLLGKGNIQRILSVCVRLERLTIHADAHLIAELRGRQGEGELLHLRRGEHEIIEPRAIEGGRRQHDRAAGGNGQAAQRGHNARTHHELLLQRRAVDLRSRFQRQRVFRNVFCGAGGKTVEGDRAIPVQLEGVYIRLLSQNGIGERDIIQLNIIRIGIQPEVDVPAGFAVLTVVQAAAIVDIQIVGEYLGILHGFAATVHEVKLSAVGNLIFRKAQVLHQHQRQHMHGDPGRFHARREGERLHGFERIENRGFRVGQIRIVGARPRNRNAGFHAVHRRPCAGGQIFRFAIIGGGQFQRGSIVQADGGDLRKRGFIADGDGEGDEPGVFAEGNALGQIDLRREHIGSGDIAIIARFARPMHCAGEVEPAGGDDYRGGQTFRLTAENCGIICAHMIGQAHDVRHGGVLHAFEIQIGIAAMVFHGEIEQEMLRAQHAAAHRRRIEGRARPGIERQGIQIIAVLHLVSRADEGARIGAAGGHAAHIVAVRQRRTAAGHAADIVVANDPAEVVACACAAHQFGEYIFADSKNAADAIEALDVTRVIALFHHGIAGDAAGAHAAYSIVDDVAMIDAARNRGDITDPSAANAANAITTGADIAVVGAIADVAGKSSDNAADVVGDYISSGAVLNLPVVRQIGAGTITDDAANALAIIAIVFENAADGDRTIVYAVLRP